MGMSLNIHIGAYLIIKPQVLIEDPGPKICKNHLKQCFGIDEKYCSTCGSELLNTTKTRVANFYDLVPEEYEDLVTNIHPESMNEKDKSRFIIIGNQYFNETPDYIKNELEYGGQVEITSDMAQRFINNFLQNYRKVIDILKEDAESVEVKFGVLTYYI